MSNKISLSVAVILAAIVDGDTRPLTLEVISMAAAIPGEQAQTQTAVPETINTGDDLKSRVVDFIQASSDRFHSRSTKAIADGLGADLARVENIVRTNSDVFETRQSVRNLGTLVSLAA